ncbi:MAG TPA: hypothetical protein VN193_08500 [Candidatus Angelobacter sp.]|jgi:hypothetical protein|nr:hypothetical protein [Candidatus Angelobacter sp.]
MSVVRFDDVNRRECAVASATLVAPAAQRGMGQDAVGALTGAHRIAAPPQRTQRMSSARRRGMVLIGAMVLVASLAGALLGRLLAAA